MKRYLGNKTPILFLQLFAWLLLIPGFSPECLSMDRIPVPTVTVIDEETGEPVEGAIAIAIWRKVSWETGAWFEGGGLKTLRIEETVSDSKGNIYIDGFWDWHFFGMDPHLDIYKPGYVCWDQSAIYIDKRHRLKRIDFDKNHRIAQIKKWPEVFSFEGHRIFVDDVTLGEYMHSPTQLFNEAFYNCEIQYRKKERDKKWKEEDEEKKRRINQ